MKTLAIISIATFLVTNVIKKLNDIKQGKNVWDL